MNNVLGTCQACGRDLPKQGRGRPRKWCEDCSPSVAKAGKAATVAAWRRLNADKVAERNQSRRRMVRTVYCHDCGRPFASTRTDVHRCEDCRREESAE